MFVCSCVSVCMVIQMVLFGRHRFVSFFFFNDTATTEIYTLSLHDALPICAACPDRPKPACPRRNGVAGPDRKSTRLNSSHPSNSYAVFCLKKNKDHRK